VLIALLRRDVDVLIENLFAGAIFSSPHPNLSPDQVGVNGVDSYHGNRAGINRKLKASAVD
jgi:hypothetical protein